ncbi:15739_t:CDS:2, partial [Racocetra fulgida]
GSLIWWPPTSPLGEPLIVYIKCDRNYTLNIISAQGSNNTVAIILNYDGKPCQFTSSDIIVPLFNEVNNDCHSNKIDSNMTFPGLEATIKIDSSTPTNVAAEMPPIDNQDQDNSNSKHGITKAVLESFPVYFFSLRNNTDPKNSENSEKEENISNLDSENSESDPDNITVDKIRRLSPIDENFDDIVIIVNNDSTLSPEISSPITDDQLTCPICLGDFESGEELRILPCHHQYHITCIDPWLLDISPLCPMCKADYTSWKINSVTTINDVASRSSLSLGSVGILSEAIDSDVTTTTQNEGESSTQTFPHFRWAKYLKAIRRGRRVARNIQVQSRLSVGDILSSPQSNHNTSRSNLSIDNGEESRVR